MSEHKNVYLALCAAQASMGTVVKGSVNPAFKSKYADLADVVAVAVPALTAQGIALHHSMVQNEHGMAMRTTLSHGATDTHIHCDVPLIVDRNNMQGMKSATTYAKRIGLESLTGIAPEDDDGNAAANSNNGYTAFEAANLKPMRDAAMSGTVALEDAFKKIPKSEHKEVFWAKHSASLKAAAKAAEKQTDAEEVL